MIIKRPSLLAMFFVAAAVVVASAAEVPAQVNGCLSRTEAAVAVRSGRVVSLSQLLGRYPNISGADVVSAELCQKGSGYYYLVSVLRGGTVKTVTVDATAKR